MIVAVRRLFPTWARWGLLVLCLATTARGEAKADPRKSYAGTFEFVGGERERKAREAAIERATAGLFFVVRGIARGRLRERTEIAPWVRFEFPPSWIRATVPGHAAALSRDNGAPVRFEVDGEVVELRQYFAGQRLIQRFVAPDGSRTNEYRIDAKGTLTLRVTVESPKLSRPLQYRLTYRR